MALTSESLFAVFDALHIGISVIDEDNRIILMNRLFGEMVHQNPEERIGTSVLGCHPAKSQPAVEKMMSDLRNGAIDHSEAWINFRGRIIYEYLYPIKDRDGRFVGIADELHDAADRAEHLKELGVWKELPISGLAELAPGDTGE